MTEKRLKTEIKAIDEKIESLKREKLKRLVEFKELLCGLFGGC
jgi:hypothetical protein